MLSHGIVSYCSQFLLSPHVSSSLMPGTHSMLGGQRESEEQRARRLLEPDCPYSEKLVLIMPTVSSCVPFSGICDSVEKQRLRPIGQSLRNAPLSQLVFLFFLTNSPLTADTATMEDCRTWREGKLGKHRLGRKQLIQQDDKQTHDINTQHSNREYKTWQMSWSQQIIHKP